MRLNVGCGEHYASGWINTDLHDNGPKPDTLCSILQLPFADGSVGRVYLGHMLEHVALGDVPLALAEVRRVLAVGGELLVVGPDVDLTRVHEPVLMDGVLHGGCRWPGDEHRWPATGGETLRLVLAAGFAARLFPVCDVPVGWPVVDRAALWQFAIEARPEERA